MGDRRVRCQQVDCVGIEESVVISFEVVMDGDSDDGDESGDGKEEKMITKSVALVRVV